jgi:hypothetical protein
VVDALRRTTQSKCVAAHRGSAALAAPLLPDCGRWDEHHLAVRQSSSRASCELGVARHYEEFEGGHMNVAHRYDVSLRAVSAALG